MNIQPYVLWTGILLMSTAAVAGIQPSGTRVIYPGDKQEVTFKLSNNASTPRLIQAWVGREEEAVQDKASRIPFLVIPPIFRIDPDKGQTLRILFLGGDLPQDRESVFWLNILELQPKPAGKSLGENNAVQFSIRTRLKLFYRPKDLPGKPENAIAQLRWRMISQDKKTHLECVNPSAFNISFHDLRLKNNPDNNQETLNGMCPSKGKQIFLIKNPTHPTSGQILLNTINDHGGFDEQEVNYSYYNDTHKEIK